MKQTMTYVIGHRNPDPDSICSAIAYAALLQLQGQKNILPARAGNLNKQTEFVLDYFGQQSPRRLSDVYPRVGDVISEEPVKIGLDEPLAQLSRHAAFGLLVAVIGALHEQGHLFVDGHG